MLALHLALRRWQTLGCKLCGAEAGVGTGKRPRDEKRGRDASCTHWCEQVHRCNLLSVPSLEAGLPDRMYSNIDSVGLSWVPIPAHHRCLVCCWDSSELPDPEEAAAFCIHREKRS